MTRRRKIVLSGASRNHVAGEFVLLLGGAGVEAPPDGSGSEGRDPFPRPSPSRAVALLLDDAEGSALGQENEMASPSWHRIDRFGLADVRREYRLRPAEAYCLSQIVNLCDFRCRCWTGGLSELAAFTGQGRKTVSAAVHRLAEVEAVEILDPFTTTDGTLQVLVWDRLVVSGSASASRRLRARYASDDASDERKGLSAGALREEVGGIDARVPLTRDRPSLGAYRRVVEAFPGAEVS